MEEQNDPFPCQPLLHLYLSGAVKQHRGANTGANRSCERLLSSQSLAYQIGSDRSKLWAVTTQQQHCTCLHELGLLGEIGSQARRRRKNIPPVLNSAHIPLLTVFLALFFWHCFCSTAYNNAIIANHINARSWENNSALAYQTYLCLLYYYAVWSAWGQHKLIVQ